jgi:hypothetical protein
MEHTLNSQPVPLYSPICEYKAAISSYLLRYRERFIVAPTRSLIIRCVLGSRWSAFSSLFTDEAPFDEAIDLSAASLEQSGLIESVDGSIRNLMGRTC